MSTVSGAYGVGDPPVPIPNTEVKTHCGNNTWTTRSWQDSTVPDLNTKPTPPTRSVGGVGCLKHQIQRRRHAEADEVVRNMLQAPRSNRQTDSYGACTNRVRVDPPPTPPSNTEAKTHCESILGHSVLVRYNGFISSSTTHPST